MQVPVVPTQQPWPLSTDPAVQSLLLLVGTYASSPTSMRLLLYVSTWAVIKGYPLSPCVISACCAEDVFLFCTWGFPFASAQRLMNVNLIPVRTEEPARISQHPLLVTVLMALWESSVKQVGNVTGSRSTQAPPSHCKGFQASTPLMCLRESHGDSAGLPMLANLDWSTLETPGLLACRGTGQPCQG